MSMMDMNKSKESEFLPKTKRVKPIKSNLQDRLKMQPINIG